MKPEIVLPEISLSDVDARVRKLQEQISEGETAISRAEAGISATKLGIVINTHELSYWNSLGRILSAEKLDRCRDLIVDAISSSVPRDRALVEIHGLSHAIFFLQMNAISNRYGLVEAAKMMISELKAQVPTWFSSSEVTRRENAETTPSP